MKITILEDWHLRGMNHWNQSRFKKAVYWFQRASMQDHLPSIHALAFAYLKGQGVDENINRGISMIKFAASKGHQPSIDAIDFIMNNDSDTQTNNQ